MTLRKLIELGANHYTKFSEEVKQVYDLMLLGMMIGEIPNEILDKELSEEDLEYVPEKQKGALIKSLDFIEKFYESDTYKDKNVIKCSDIAELNGKKCGNFTLEVVYSDKNIEVKVVSYFGGMKGYMNVYEVTLDNINHTTETVIKDLKVFGFDIQLEEKEKEISYRDTSTGKLVGIIKHKNDKLIQAKLGKFKYVNLAEMFKELNKDIEAFNTNLTNIFGKDIEILNS